MNKAVCYLLFASFLLPIIITDANAQNQKDNRTIPPEAKAAYEVGLNHKRNKKHQWAVTKLQEAIRLCRHYTDAHWALAWTYDEMNDRPNAIDAFRQTVCHDVEGEKTATAARYLVRNKADIPMQVYMMNADGTENRCLGLPSLPVQAPGNGLLAFTWKYQDQAFPDIWLANMRGEVIGNLTNSKDVWERSIAWSPDGTQIAFSWKKGQDFGLSVIDIDTRAVSVIFGDRVIDAPSWSPDGERLVFQDSNRIWVANSDGTELRALTSGPMRARTPFWSALNTIVFCGFQNQVWNILGINPDAEEAEPEVIIISDGHDIDPFFSPCGNQLLFASTRVRLRSSDLYTYDMTSGCETRLTVDELSEGPATWSPDGKFIYYQKAVARPELPDAT